MCMACNHNPKPEARPIGNWWIRRDRADMTLTRVNRSQVASKLTEHYEDVDAAMRAASRKAPLTTGFADYWPVLNPDAPIFENKPK